MLFSLPLAELPLHPAIVHLPLGLSMVMPLLTLALLVGRRWLGPPAVALVAGVALVAFGAAVTFGAAVAFRAAPLSLFHHQCPLTMVAMPAAQAAAMAARKAQRAVRVRARLRTVR